MQEIGRELITEEEPNEGERKKSEQPDRKEPKEEGGVPRQEGGDDLNPEPEQGVSPLEVIRRERKELGNRYTDLIAKASPKEKPELRKKYQEEDAELEKKSQEAIKQERSVERKPIGDIVKERWSKHLAKLLIEYPKSKYPESSGRGFISSRDPEIVAEDIRQFMEGLYFTLSDDEKKRFTNPDEAIKEWKDYAVQRVIESLQKARGVDKPEKVKK